MCPRAISRRDAERGNRSKNGVERQSLIRGDQQDTAALPQAASATLPSQGHCLGLLFLVCFLAKLSSKRLLNRMNQKMTVLHTKSSTFLLRCGPGIHQSVKQPTLDLLQPPLGKRLFNKRLLDFRLQCSPLLTRILRYSGQNKTKNIGTLHKSRPTCLCNGAASAGGVQVQV